MSIRNKINKLVEKRNKILANAMTIDDKKRRELDKINSKIANLESFINAEQTANKK